MTLCCWLNRGSGCVVIDNCKNDNTNSRRQHQNCGNAASCRTLRPSPLLPHSNQAFPIFIQRLLVQHRKTINNQFGLEHNAEARRISLLDTGSGSVKKIKNAYWLFFGVEQATIRWKSEAFGVDMTAGAFIFGENHCCFHSVVVMIF